MGLGLEGRKKVIGSAFLIRAAGCGFCELTNNMDRICDEPSISFFNQDRFVVVNYAVIRLRSKRDLDLAWLKFLYASNAEVPTLDGPGAHSFPLSKFCFAGPQKQGGRT